MKPFLKYILLVVLTTFAFPLLGIGRFDLNEEERVNTSDIHGVLDVVFKNDYITPRGLLVSDTGLTVQILSKLILDVYQNPDEIVSRVSLFAGVWNDIWTAQHDPTAKSWNELDWFVGIDTTFAKDWKFRTQFIQFVSPPGNFTPESNAEFILFYDDSIWDKPVVFNPYVELFWAIAGDSTVVVGRPGNTYYVEFGFIPTVNLDTCFPIAISMPSWISVGPANFWNGGDQALKNENSHFGVFSTGLRAEIGLDFIPTSFGKWYVDFGTQYYHLINDNLLQAQIFTLDLPSIQSAKRNVFVGFAGLGFNY